jgi:hypothetical protein
MKLIQGKKYDLVYNGMFCHIVTDDGICSNMESIKKIEYYNPYTFIGEVEVSIGGFRNIFISSALKGTAYIMYGIKNVENYATPYKKCKVTMREVAEKFGVDIDEIEIIP